MMTIVSVPQGSPEWLEARAGKVTASRISDVLAKVKTGEAAGRRDYRAQLVAEILTGRPQESGFMNDAMRWGTEQEPYARAAYECQAGVLVDQVGMVLHPSIERGAAAPAVPGPHPAGRMSPKVRGRLALATAAVFFGWPIIRNLPDALEALALFFGV